MAKVADVFVSVILVVDARAHAVGKKVKSLNTLLKAGYTNYEVVIIDNGMPVETLATVKELLLTLPCIRVLRLSRNHDTDTAIFAGVEASIGDYVCILYNNDPTNHVTEFIKQNQKYDIVFGVADNLKRQGRIEQVGAKLFYWYSKKYLGIQMPKNATYFISINRSVANALTRSGRFMRHIRHMAQRVGFSATTLKYSLPETERVYSHAKTGTLLSRAIDLISNYSSHPLRIVSYFGVVGGIFNIGYAVYVVIINLSHQDIAKGWTTLSLQSSLMFFLLFLILAVLAEYIGKILNETQQEPPYHIMQELSSTINVADETRLNVTK